MKDFKIRFRDKFNYFHLKLVNGVNKITTDIYKFYYEFK